LILSVLALGVLIAVGAAYDDVAFDGAQSYGQSSHGGDDRSHGGDSDFGDRHKSPDFNKYYDWLSPGGYYYSYSWYPSYSYWYYPTYTYPTYNYPVYTPPVYTPPVYTYPTYTAPVYTYFEPVSYDPWWVANVYGWGGATYYYSSSWTWSSGRGLLFY
jgi:hypothetical protein